MPLLRHRRNSTGRYVHIPEIDRRRAAKFYMPPPPERDAVLQQISQIIESLKEAIDEGNGAVLDRLIESWTAAWIATVEADYTDHCAAIAVHRAQAEQWLEESIRIARYENEELGRLRAAYLASRNRLSGEQPGSGHLSDEHTDTWGDLS